MGVLRNEPLDLPLSFRADNLHHGRERRHLSRGVPYSRYERTRDLRKSYHNPTLNRLNDREISNNGGHNSARVEELVNSNETMSRIRDQSRDVVTERRTTKRKVPKANVRVDMKRVRTKPERRSKRLNPRESPPPSPLPLPSIFGSETSIDGQRGSDGETDGSFEEWTNRKNPNFRWHYVFKGKKRKPTPREFYDDYIPRRRMYRNRSFSDFDKLNNVY